MVIKWVENDDLSPHENLIAFGFTESVLFGGSFTSIGWLKNLGGLMPGLTTTNDLISRDEGLHCMNSAVLSHKVFFFNISIKLILPEKAKR